MSRQFKFRVWDKLEKSFIYPDKGYCGHGHFILDLNGRFHNLQNGSGGEEYVVQQFTGLKDSNGKDIYEGDILKYKSFGSGFEKVLVRWTEEYHDNHPGWIISDSYNQHGEPEIIGNIFENSELLQKLT